MAFFLKYFQFQASIVLDTLVCAFSKYCKEEFQVERCKVISNSVSEWFPQLSYRIEHLSSKKINKYLGLKWVWTNFCILLFRLFLSLAESCKLFYFRLSDNEIVDLLNRMSLNAQQTPGQGIQVEIPPTRHDIIHACDIIEDVAIAVGYNNIPKALPDCCTVAHQVSGNCHLVLWGCVNRMLIFSLFDLVSSKWFDWAVATPYCLLWFLGRINILFGKNQSNYIYYVW